jgi:HEAT repeat protein
LTARQTPRHELAVAARNLGERVRAQAIKSLALIGAPSAFEIIRCLRNDPSRHVRSCAAGALRANT